MLRAATLSRFEGVLLVRGVSRFVSQEEARATFLTLAEVLSGFVYRQNSVLF